MRLNTSPMPPQGNLLVTRGFCVNRDGEARLLAHGIEAKSIWMRGRGGESMDRCLRSYRGRPGVLKVADDLTIFGQTRQDIFGVTKALHAGKIGLHDIALDETNPSELEHQALKVISAKGGACDPRTARKRGRLGGDAKGVAAAEKRNAILREDAVRRLVNDSGVGIKRLAKLLGPPFSASTLIRKYRI